MKTKAIRHAREYVSQLYPMGCGYYYKRWDDKLNAWRVSQPRSYCRAQSARAQALIDEARDYLGWTPIQYDGGKWTNYVKFNH